MLLGWRMGIFSGLKKIHIHKLCNGELPEKPRVVGRECTGTMFLLCATPTHRSLRLSVPSTFTTGNLG